MAVSYWNRFYAVRARFSKDGRGAWFVDGKEGGGGVHLGFAVTLVRPHGRTHVIGAVVSVCDLWGSAEYASALVVLARVRAVPARSKRVERCGSSSSSNGWFM